MLKEYAQTKGSNYKKIFLEDVVGECFTNYYFESLLFIKATYSKNIDNAYYTNNNLG